MPEPVLGLTLTPELKPGLLPVLLMELKFWLLPQMKPHLLPGLVQTLTLERKPGLTLVRKPGLTPELKT